MKIYRLETSSGVGVYNNDNTANTINGCVAGDRWPMPDQDEKLRNDILKKSETSFTGKVITQNIDDDLSWLPVIAFDTYHRHDYRFGFRSKTQMKRWVCKKKWRKELADKNILLNVYEVDPKFVMIGTSQCTFFQEKAKLVESLSPTHFG